MNKVIWSMFLGVALLLAACSSATDLQLSATATATMTPETSSGTTADQESSSIFGINLSNLPLWGNGLIFVVAAAVVWFAGTRIAFYADEISERTGLERAIMGLIFVALATELPEIATTVTAAIGGNASLATSNIFGGIVLQTTILAIVDIVVLRNALTYVTPRPILLLQGVFLVMVIGLALAAIVAGEFVTIFHVGGWTIFLLFAYVASIYMSQGYSESDEWQPVAHADEDDQEPEADTHAAESPAQDSEQERNYTDWSLRRLILFALLNSAFILIAGYTLVKASEALAVQTGLGDSFVGATLLATSTSLPELSTSIAAARLGSYALAISNIFGSNTIMILLLFISDLFYTPGPILAEVGLASRFTAAMGIVVTAVYLAGIIERKNRTVLRMGIDSLVVLALYILNVVVLYMLR